MNHPLLFIGLALLVLSHTAIAQNSNALAIQPEKASPELANQWWQWAMASPRESSPVSDRTGDRCADGQTGDIWFLAGGYGSSKITRKCKVPAGRTLFFPLINMVYWPTREGTTSFTCSRAKALAALNNDTAIDLFAEVDGRPVAALKEYRVTSEQCFDVLARAAASEMKYKAYPSATDGYWLKLKPLPPGRHSLKFGGRYNRSSEDYGRMVQDIEYELVVE
jgi:hypothetical protein